MNHTSDEHPWFQASRRREAPYTDWYIWRDPGGTDRRGRPLPPNDWVSWFGGPAWTFDPVRGQFYHHTFLAEQPEPDWRVPAVEAAQWAMVRGWLERGVDGFRLDTFNVFLKHPDMPVQPAPPRALGVDPPGAPLRLRPARPARPARPLPGRSSTPIRGRCRSASCSWARPRARPR